MVDRSLRRVAGLGLVLLALASPASAITFSPFVTGADLSAGLGNTAAIGFSYAGDRFVGSVYFGANNNQLYQTNLGGGGLSLFGSPIPGASGEIYVSSSLGLGAWPSRDIYAAQGNGVYHITHTGTNVGTFVSGLNGGVRGIAFDPYGLYNFDMIVTTNAGGVYRVDAAGTPTLIASGLGDTEGLDFAPQAFGPIPAHTLFVMSEGSGQINAIAPTGAQTNLGLFIPTAEMLAFVPLNLGVSGNPVEGFYAAAYPTHVTKAPASEFTAFRGDAIATSEFGNGVDAVWHIFYDAASASFHAVNLGDFPGQPEDGIFVTAALITPGCEVTGTCGPRTSVPEPLTAGLLGLGLLAMGAMRRRGG